MIAAKKLSDSFFLPTLKVLESTDRYYHIKRRGGLTNSMKWIFQKHAQKNEKNGVFEKKKKSILSFRRKKYYDS